MNPIYLELPQSVGDKLVLGKKIGILGGGQLARMSAYQAYKLGFEIAILEKKYNSPAGMLTKNDFEGWVEDEEQLLKFAGDCDVITLENEFIDSAYLKKLEDIGKVVIPSSKTISKIQDKFIQKSVFSKAGLQVPKFIELGESHSYEEVAEQLGERFVIKSRKFGYDGYGNALVSDEVTYKNGIEKLSDRHAFLMAEEFIDFTEELAIMVVKTQNEIKTYPLVKTIQKNHICHTVIASANIDIKLQKEAEEIAGRALSAIDGFGLYGIEFFRKKDDTLLINEIAPRPHNTGHYTIEGCKTSQFENHIRAVLNLPLGYTSLNKQFAVMVNLLGKRTGSGVPQNYNEVLKYDDAHFHIYGKAEDKKGRKMGHVTLVGDDLDELIEKANKIENEIDL